LNAATAVRGVGIAEIQLLDGNVDVPNNTTSSGYAAAIGANVTRTYRIRNQGTLDLNLSALVVASGPFTILTGFADSVLSVGEATTFTVRFAPTAGGTFNRDLTFTSNDADEGTFVVHLNGTAPMPPQITTISVNSGAAQRSMVTSLTVTFDRIVTLPAQPASAFTVAGPSGNVTIAASAATVGGVTVATITFPGLVGGSLADGNYSLTVLGNQISAGGVALDGDGDAVPGGNANYSLFRFFGDSNGDRRVDIADFGVFSGTYNLSTGQTGFLSYFDFNADGHIDIADFGQFSLRMFTTLP
jgi:HYDIN/CFA65/VesB-like, Ig-like domain